MFEIIALIIIAGTILAIMFIQRLFIHQACKHEWKIFKTVRVYTVCSPDYDRIYLRCKKCGKLKCKNMK